MNVHESEKIAGILMEMGYLNTNEIEEADVIVFNTCCIRENAENHAYGNIGMLKKLKSQKRDLIIAVGGCLTQQIGKADILLKKFPYVDIIFGTHNLTNFRDLLEKKRSQKKAVVEIKSDDGKVYDDEKPFRTSYPNAWINITYGCNNFCTYCIVPYVRGRERSRSSESIINEAKELIELGYKEITLLGQNVNSYANDTDDISFPELLKKIAAIDGKFRLRFMTSHPKDFSEELAKVIAETPKICKCLHLPVQSGSDSILKAMNRRYTSADYLKKVKVLKDLCPECTITTDLIVGFPGESDEDFEGTKRLVKEVGFSSAFTFVYSKREGTKAATFENQVPAEVSKKRIMELIDLVNSQTRGLSRSYIGKSVEVLCEDYDKKRELFMGRDEFGRMAYFESKKNLIGEFVLVKVLDANGISLTGEVVE